MKKRNLAASILAVVILVLWQLLAMKVNIPHIIPSPAAIVKKTWELRETLFLVQLPVTLYTIVVGFLISVGISLVLATAMEEFEVVEAMFYPVLVVTQTIPVMCISPLFVLWFGYTQTARIIAVVLATFFAITLNVFDGLKRTDVRKIELMQTIGASPLQIFLHVKVPTALPMFFTALKMTLPWAVIDAAVAEWLGANEGLGYFSKRMISTMDGPAVFAPVLTLTVIALMGMAILNVIDKKASVYRSEV